MARRIYTYGGKPARRNLTVADIVALKGVRKLAVKGETYPDTATSVAMPPDELDKFLEALERRPIFDT